MLDVNVGNADWLSIILRYLVTSDAFSNIADSYRMSDASVGRIVKETSNVLWKRLSEGRFVKQPDNTVERRNIAKQYEKCWNFPNSPGAISGKHVTIQCSARGGSMYVNNRKIHSIVLLTAVNVWCRFSVVDIGNYGRLSDISMYANSNLRRATNQNF